MRFIGRITRWLGMAPALVVVAGLVAGCEAGGGQTSEYKPIESDILKKLNKASSDQSQVSVQKSPRTDRSP